MGATAVQARSHVSNQAKKETVRNWCPGDLPWQCEKLKREQWMCNMPKGNQCHRDGNFSRTGCEGKARESHMTSGQQSELDVQTCEHGLGLWAQQRWIESQGTVVAQKGLCSSQTSCRVAGVGVLPRCPPQACQLQSLALSMPAVASPLHGHSGPHRPALH